MLHQGGSGDNAIGGSEVYRVAMDPNGDNTSHDGQVYINPQGPGCTNYMMLTGRANMQAHSIDREKILAFVMCHTCTNKR